MLTVGELKAGETMFDPGSGDGRIVIMAAQRFHADVTGVELHKNVVRQSLERIRKPGLEKSARVGAYDFAFRGWTAEKTETIANDGEGLSHKLYLYRK